MRDGLGERFRYGSEQTMDGIRRLPYSLSAQPRRFCCGTPVKSRSMFKNQPAT
jgi:hypothetical protein